MTILIFFLVLFVLILVHEWGHFIVAKKTGMRVDEFGIGFPPKLFGFKKGETEYTFNLFPIGGFVRIYGENAADADGDAQKGGDISKSFTSKSKWAQAAVLIAGVTMNIILAWFLFFIVFATGTLTAVDESTASAEADLVVLTVIPNTPAYEAGIPVGAKILGYLDGVENEELTPSAFSAQSTNEDIVPLHIMYEVKGKITTVEVTPVRGLIADDVNKPALGVSVSLMEVVRRPILTSFIDATKTTYETTVAIVVGITGLFVDILEQDADLSQIAGPIGIVSLVGDAAQFGLASLLLFTAVISLNLAVINLLPIPALDGGRLLFVAIEAIMRKPINPKWVVRLNTAGFFVLIILMVAVTYSDILKKFVD